MPVFRLGVAVAGICISTIVLFQLFSLLQPHGHYANLDTAKKLFRGRDRQYGDDVYLLGAGKADITGYVGLSFLSLLIVRSYPLYSTTATSAAANLRPGQ